MMLEATAHPAAHKHVRHAIARLLTLDAHIAPFAQVDFAALPPAQAGFLLRHVAQLKSARTGVAQALHGHQHNQALALQRSRARQIEEGRAALHQQIDDWSPEVAQRILQAGKTRGFSEAELHAVTDPRIILLLNTARLSDENQTRPSSGAPSGMTTAEWMRWRAKQLPKRNTT